MSTRIRRPSDPELPSLHEHVERWVAAAIIDREEAEAIELFETQQPARPAATPLVVEALAYLGGALALAATIVIFSRVWPDLDAGVRVAALAAGAVVAFVSGWVLRRSEEPAIDRLVCVLWGVAVATAGWCAGLVAYDLFDLRGRPPAAIGGGAATVVALCLYFPHRRMIQQLALFGAIVFTLNQGIVSQLSHGALSVAAGAGWIVLGWRELVLPRRPALWFGSAAAMFGGMMAIGDQSAAGFAIGIVVAVALIGGSVALRELVMLALGVFGLFQSLLATIGHYFANSIAMAIALVVAGGVAFAFALILARRSRRGTRSFLDRSG